MNNLNPDEIRSAFNRQHPGHGGPEWVRLNLSAGPVLARRNVGHHSSPIYVVVIDNGMARHWMVTLKRQLKSNGSSNITTELRISWQALIGYTETEYRQAKEQNPVTEMKRKLYEQGPSP